MVVKTIIHGSIDISQKHLKFGPSELYEFYTAACAQRDVEKDGIAPFLKAEDRLEACRRLAVAMFNGATTLLSNEQLLSLLRMIQFKTPISRSISPNEFFQRALTDIRVCSFLTRDGDDALKFSHTSFMEFFFAQEIVQKCRLSLEFMGEHLRAASRISVVYFLGSFARSDEHFAHQIGLALQAMSDATTEWSRKDKDFNELILRIAWASGVLLKNRHLKKCTISDSRLGKSDISGVYLDRVSLNNVTLIDSELNRGFLVRCSLADITISRVTIDQCNLDFTARDVTLSDSVLQGGKFSVENVLKADAIELSKTHSRDWLVQRCLFKAVKTKISGKGLIVETRFQDGCSLSFNSGTYLERGTAFCANDCVIFGTKMGRGGSELQGPQVSWLAEGGSAVFTNCTLLGLWMADRDILRLDSSSPERTGRIQLHDCKGVVLTEDRYANITGQTFAKLSRIYPHISFLNLAVLSRLKQHKEYLQLRGKDCNLNSICSRLAEARSQFIDEGTRWSLERLQQVSDTFRLHLDKIPDFVEHMKALSIS
jgi:uncharacterized protein YjbI with pentapeptide repeats